ncbi:serine carboxypeptidase [Pochonia chlamydosporia 170]|uniref:carboxypeptidase C n=1 Tax=Pochonia chlamydosporia 170 TaxID=1380566 RepID=A0A179EX55_METCM|nr:serine carboxypeptidase [Pochonia chlamydosporia 170]XP_022284901.1 serine carboxypeptidase [Pochonia chlamydosporia 170]OAQ57785.1 serine carboxypeptidase [Pochonia chlamydosporia 170]OWT42372.1 serine carboxypeptidase [Pochonia chlamydosporia 170]
MRISDLAFLFGAKLVASVGGSSASGAGLLAAYNGNVSTIQDSGKPAAVASYLQRTNPSGEPRNCQPKAKTADPSSLGVDNVKQFSGYLDDKAQDKHLFYWFFESRNDPAKDPVILWIEGGPGCSSMLGLFQQLGPARINGKLKPVPNPFSWNSRASIIFLDSPVNAGFSRSRQRVNSTEAAAKDVYKAMQVFFQQFPEYARQDFHVAGSSYSGHYVPAIAAEMLSHEDRNMNLKSAIIGDGITDALVQFQSYRPMACGEGGIAAVVNETVCQAMKEVEPKCRDQIQSCYDTADATTCSHALDVCNNALISPVADNGVNIYNLREQCSGNFTNFCSKSVPPITSWLNQRDVMKTLGVEGVDRWEVCSASIFSDFLGTGDWVKPLQQQVSKALEKIPVLVFAGDGDFICNWLGNRAWTEALEWPGRDAFSMAQTQRIRVTSGTNSGDYGEIKAADNFAFARIFDAGHFAILDQPEATLDLVNRWMAGEWTQR